MVTRVDRTTAGPDLLFYNVFRTDWHLEGNFSKLTSEEETAESSAYQIYLPNQVYCANFDRIYLFSNPLSLPPVKIPTVHYNDSRMNSATLLSRKRKLVEI